MDPDAPSSSSNDLVHIGSKEVHVEPLPSNKEEGDNIEAESGENSIGDNRKEDPKPLSGDEASTKPDSKKEEKKRGAKDAANSLAFLILRKLVEEEKISEDTAKKYRLMYEKLNETVVDVFENETLLYNINSKQKRAFVGLRKGIEEKKKKLESLKGACEDANGRKNALRKEVDAKELDLKLVDSQLQNFLNQETDKQKQLEEMKKSKEAAAKPLIDDLNQKVRDSLEEIRMQKENTVKEKEAKELYLEEIEKLKQDIESLQKDKHEKRRKLAFEMRTPDKIRSEADAISRTRAKKEKENLLLIEEIKKLKELVKAKQDKRLRVKHEVNQHKQNQTRHRGALQVRRDELAEIEKNLEHCKQKRIEMMERIQSLKTEIEHQRNRARTFVNKEKQNKKIKNEEIRRGERLRRKLETILAIIPSLRDQRDLLARDITRTNKDIQTVSAEVKELMNDKDVLLFMHLEIEDADVVASEKLQEAVKKVREAKEKVEELQKREISLRRTISEWAAKRELQGRETSRAITKYREMTEMWKIKNMVNRDLEKQVLDLERTVKLRGEEYKRMRNIKEKCVNQVQISESTLNEVREKIQILQHEVQILHQETQVREVAYKEESRSHQILIHQRMHKREDRSKLKAEHKKLRQWQDHQLKEIASLNQIVNTLAKKAKAIKAKYAKAVEARNTSGIRVIDRADELSILDEKSKIQKSILAKGTDELRNRDALLENLNRELAEFSRTRAALLKRKPGQELWYATRKTLESSQRQLAQERRTVLDLSQALATPDRPKEDGSSRIKKLSGFDPDKQQLQTKIEVLEEKLQEKKERLVEKDLILHEVANMSNQLCKEAAENRTWTLELAKKINEYQAQIRQLTRSQKATVSELSMYQATALKLEQERKASVDMFEEARARMAQGEAPTDGAEGEWVRMIRERQRQKDILLSRKQQIRELMNARPDVIPSHAEQRSNAYISEELGIPKPYGHLAPFKPSVLGATMRHIRKGYGRKPDR